MLAPSFPRPDAQREEHRAGVETPIELTAATTLWTEISARLQGTLNETTYSTWFGEVEGGDLADDAFVLVVPNDFTREWIEGHFLKRRFF